MARSRRVLIVVAVVDALLLVAALGILVTRLSEDDADGSSGSNGVAAGAPPAVDPATEVPVPGGTTGLPGRRSSGRGEVDKRPWPARVAAPGPWSSTLAGRGDRAQFTAPGTVEGGIGRASFRLGSDDPRPREGKDLPRTNRFLALPDGSRWFPLGLTRLEGLTSLGFSSAVAHGDELSVVSPSLDSILAGRGGVTGIGTFVQPDGREVERLALPAGTKVGTTCVPPPNGLPCTEDAPPPLAVEVGAEPGLSIRVAGAGEAAVAGTARATALGRTWEGLVAAVEAQRLRAAAAYDGDRWTVTAEGASARQVWVDVWPVVDTRLTATSKGNRSTGFFDALAGDTYPVGIQWTNVGFATSQILEAEGVGPGAPSVGFDLNKTEGHDAGLGVRRGDRVVNMRGGGDIDSNLAPGESVDRGLSTPRGAGATVVLRGNFPEVRVALAIPTA